MARVPAAVCLALNGVLSMLVGLLAGAAIPFVPYTRLMLSAHNAGFTISGMLSMVAGLLLGSSMCSLSQRAATVVIWAHVALWPLSLSEVAGFAYSSWYHTPVVMRVAIARNRKFEKELHCTIRGESDTTVHSKSCKLMKTSREIDITGSSPKGENMPVARS